MLDLCQAVHLPCTKTMLLLLQPIRKNSNGGNVYIAPPPIVFKVETGFKPVAIQQTVSISMKNYDGSETHQTIMKDKSYETLSEVTLGESGQVLAKSLKRGKWLSTSGVFHQLMLVLIS